MFFMALLIQKSKRKNQMRIDYVEPFIRMAINMNENNEDIKKE